MPRVSLSNQVTDLPIVKDDLCNFTWDTDHENWFGSFANVSSVSNRLNVEATATRGKAIMQRYTIPGVTYTYAVDCITPPDSEAYLYIGNTVFGTEYVNTTIATGQTTILSGAFKATAGDIWLTFTTVVNTKVIIWDNFVIKEED